MNPGSGNQETGNKKQIILSTIIKDIPKILNVMKNSKLYLLGICAIVSLMACKAKTEVQKENARLSVTTPLVTDTSFVKDYVAEIQSLQNIEVRAKVKGYLENINVDEGQHVNAGQVLFTIRSRDYEAELATTKAKVKTTELEMLNVKTLADKNIVSQTELALAIAKLNEAKADEGVAEANLSFTKITAPFSGIIDRLKFKVGSLIDEGTLLTTLSNNKEVYAYFNVSEKEYLDFKTRPKNDDRNIVTLLLANGQPHKYKGMIETVEGEFDRNTGSIPFRAKFPNPDYLLKHGETGKVQLTVDVKDALIIPQKATYELQDKVYVFVVDDQNIVKARNITIAQELPNLFVVSKGLSAGDKILLEGVQSVKEDDIIQPVYTPVREVIEHLQLIK
jgi:membrane fusion protein, multidrug efflux system